MNSFAKFVMIMTALIVTSVAIGLSIDSEASRNNMDTKIEIIVHPGDSLWNISEEINESYLSDKEDVRKIVYLLKEYNSLKTSDIQVGKKLVYYLD